MNPLVPGSAVLFMKVGIHASESLDAIIARKTTEIDRGGFAMWGYGGNTCHPLTIVRPFAKVCAEAHRPIRLVMEEIDSHHNKEQIAADEYSIDGIDWKPIDTAIHRVLGSRYALFIRGLREEEFELSLAQSKVAVGPCEGRRGDLYVQGRVDKACLVYEPSAEGEPANPKTTKQIKLVAELVDPYAALLRNTP
jgi:hypothetical protein